MGPFSVKQLLSSFLLVVLLVCGVASAQESDITQTPNAIDAGIQKSLEEQIGAGRGDRFTPDSSRFLIARDPFRAIAPRPAALPAQVHARAGPRPAHRRRRRRHRQSDATSIGRRARRQLRRLSRAATRLGRQSAATSSRAPTAATPRTCSASGCRRCWPTRSPATCGRSATTALNRRGAARRAGPRRGCAARTSTTAGSPRTRTARSTPRRSRASTRISGSSRSSPKARRSRSASSSSAR